MLFNSYVFLLLFLPLVLYFWWSPRVPVKARLFFLVAASYLFYGWWDYRFVSLLVVSTLVDYWAGERLHASQTSQGRKKWLMVSMASNLGLLAFFKYCGFFANSLNSIAYWAEFGGRIPVLQLVLPVGISFYTFQTMSYSIDIYRGKARPAESLLHFAAYVALFPQLIAGPIIRYEEIEDQLRAIAVRPIWSQMSKGIYFFVAGMAQKILADLIAARIDPFLADVGSLQLGTAWFCTLGYTCQLYFDFAGYSNMAVGLGHMLGFDFPQNFDSPYKSTNISSFWRRWHMTLSFWLRDYLFLPLGGSHQGHRRTLRNLFIVMALGGLWHGAGWTFVIWGIYHGVLLAFHAAWKQRGGSLPPWIGVSVTLCCVMIGWVIFRSTDLAMSGTWLAAMTGWRGVEPHIVSACGGLISIALLAGLLGIVLFAPNLWEIRFRPNLVTAMGLSVVLAICVLRFHQDSPFLYFQF